MKRSFAGLLLLLLLGAFTGAFLPEASAEEPRVGERHPALRLPTIDGKQTIDVGALAGKRVLLVQFASW